MKKITMFLFLIALSVGATKTVSANSYGGVCCQKVSMTCYHPNGMTFKDSRWVQNVDTCTGHES